MAFDSYYDVKCMREKVITSTNNPKILTELDQYINHYNQGYFRAISYIIAVAGLDKFSNWAKIMEHAQIFCMTECHIDIAVNIEHYQFIITNWEMDPLVHAKIGEFADQPYGCDTNFAGQKIAREIILRKPVIS